MRRARDALVLAITRASRRGIVAGSSATHAVARRAVLRARDRRQRYDERAADFAARFDRHRAAVELRDAARDRQSETGTAAFGTAHAALEDALAELLGDPRSAVPHGHAHESVLRTRADEHRLAAGRMVDRVAQEVLDHRLQELRVALDE